MEGNFPSYGKFPPKPYFRYPSSLPPGGPRKTPHGLMEYRYSFRSGIIPEPTFPSNVPPGGGALPIFKAHLFVARFLGRQLQEPDGASDSSRIRRVGVESGKPFFFRFPWCFFFSGKCRRFLVFLVWVFVTFFFSMFSGVGLGKKNSFCQLFGQFLGVFSCWGGKIDE